MAKKLGKTEAKAGSTVNKLANGIPPTGNLPRVAMTNDIAATNKQGAAILLHGPIPSYGTTTHIDLSAFGREK